MSRGPLRRNNFKLTNALQSFDGTFEIFNDVCWCASVLFVAEIGVVASGVKNEDRVAIFDLALANNVLPDLLQDAIDRPITLRSTPT